MATLKKMKMKMKLPVAADGYTYTVAEKRAAEANQRKRDAERKARTEKVTVEMVADKIRGEIDQTLPKRSTEAMTLGSQHGMAVRYSQGTSSRPGYPADPDTDLDTQMVWELIVKALNMMADSGEIEWEMVSDPGYMEKLVNVRRKQKPGRPKVLPAGTKQVQIRMTAEEEKKVKEFLKQLRTK